MKKNLSVIILICIVIIMCVSCGEEDNRILNSFDADLVRAVEGEDYIINYVKASVFVTNEKSNQFTVMTYDELKQEILRRKELGESIAFYITVKYTAIHELGYAEAELPLSFWSFEKGNEILYFKDTQGGSSTHSSKILPGEHYLSFYISIHNKFEYGDTYLKVIENLDVLGDDLNYKFLKFEQ